MSDFEELYTSTFTELEDARAECESLHQRVKELERLAIHNRDHIFDLLDKLATCEKGRDDLRETICGSNMVNIALQDRLAASQHYAQQLLGLLKEIDDGPIAHGHDITLDLKHRIMEAINLPHDTMSTSTPAPDALVKDAEPVYQIRPDCENWIDCTEKYFSEWKGVKRKLYAAIDAAMSKVQ